MNFNPQYITAIAKFVDLDAIRRSGYKFLIDCMYGCGRGVIAGIFTRAGIPFVEIRSELNPLFPGINPEPILPHIHATQLAVVAEKCDAGFITDGDADRIGAVDEHGNVVDAHKVFSVLLYWLLTRKGWPGDVTRAFNTTKMIDRIAAKYGRKLHEHGIGFKYICDLMLEHEILIGGEESGGIGISRHLPERDGLLNALLLANVMADEKKTLGQLVAALAGGVRRAPVRAHRHAHRRGAEAVGDCARGRAGRGRHHGRNEDSARGDDGRDQVLPRESCRATKKNAAETWLLLRASGTEPLLRVYCESCSTESVTAILEAARAFVMERRAA